VDVSALDIHFLFIGVSKVLGRIATAKDSLDNPDFPSARENTN